MSFANSHSSRPVNQEKNNSQQIFRKLSVLEAEKKIFQKQQESALQRVEKINHRLVAIDHAMAELLASLDLSPTTEDAAINKDRIAAQPVALQNNHAIADSGMAASHRLVMRY